MSVFHVTIGFEVPVTPLRLGGRRVDISQRKTFWNDTGDFSDQRGCYVFSMRAGRGELPWYVGKASSQTFEVECFAPHKINIYNEVLGDRKGTPCLTFVIPRRSRGAWPKLEIDRIEEFLIGCAVLRNSSLANKRKLPNEKWSIQGVIPGTKGAPTGEAVNFKRVMGI